MFTDKNGDPLEKPQMVITNGTKGPVYLTEGVDYTLKDGEFKLLDGGAISEGNAVIVAKDSIFAVVIVTPMDEDELTMMRKGDGVEDAVTPLRVAHTKVGESLPVKLTDGTSPTKINNFATAVGLDGNMIENISKEYTYENGEITFNVSGFFYFYATAANNDSLSGLMYVDAADSNSSGGGDRLTPPPIP